MKKCDRPGPTAAQPVRGALMAESSGRTSAELSDEPGDPISRSRRYAAGAGAGGGRGLLFTVLGEFVLPAGRPVATSAFIDVFGRLGVEEKASRQTLMLAAA